VGFGYNIQPALEPTTLSMVGGGAVEKMAAKEHKKIGV
jgi:hypothetical protein